MSSTNLHKGGYLAAILKSNKTVFTPSDIAILWGEALSPTTRVRIDYYVQNHQLIKLRRGIYAKTSDYNRLELATRILTPAYVSFETVLAQEGLIFQVYEAVFVASYITREVVIDGQSFSFRKVKDVVLTNPLGVVQRDETSIATPERALLDTLYVNSDYHIDNLRSVSWEKVFEILPIYENKRMERLINRLYRKVGE